MPIAAYLQTLVQQEQQRLKEVEKFAIPHFVYEYDELPERLRNILPGRDRFNAYNDALHALSDKGVRLTALQTRLMNAMRMTSCERMFGDELMYNYGYLESYGITEITSVLYVLFPRRGGKSTTQQVHTIAQLLTQPNGKYIALSLFARQGYDWRDSAKMYGMQLKDDERFGFTIMADNREVFMIKPIAVGTENSINVYPGGSQGSYDNLRGIGKQLTGLIIDECGTLWFSYYKQRDLY